MSSDRDFPTQAGFTFAEMLLATACLAISAGAAVPGVASHLQQTRIERATQDIVAIEGSLERFRAAHHALPDSLAELDSPVPLDPWGRPYEYVKFATRGLTEQRAYHNLPLNTEYDLYSRGGDGLTDPRLNSESGRDDVVRARDGEFVGLAANF